MLDNNNNYSEEIKPLLRLLRTEAFRFIIIQYNHHSIVKRIKADLIDHFPNRPIFNVDGREIDYRSLVDGYYKLTRGFLFIEHFEEILAKSEIYVGLNQRRDKLALYPIALIVFISSGPQKLFAREIMKKMPDLWSYRSLILDLKIDISLTELAINEGFNIDFAQLNTFLSNKTDVSSEKIKAKPLNDFKQTKKKLTIPDEDDQKSQMTPLINPMQLIGTERLNPTLLTLGSDTILRKEQELNRLLTRIKSVSLSEKKYLITAYNQIANLLVELWKFDEAIEYYLKLVKIEIGLGDVVGLATTYNNIGLIYTHKGDFKKSLEYHFKSQQIRSKTNDKAALGTTYNNIGGIYAEIGDFKKAFKYFLSAEEMFLAINYQEGLGASYNNIGSYFIKTKDWNNAITYLLKSEEVRLKIADIKGLGVTYFNLGFAYYYLNELKTALKYFDKSEVILLEMGDYNQLRIAYLQTAAIYSSTEDWGKAIDYYRKLEEIENKIGYKIGIGNVLNYIGIATSKMGDFNKAISIHLQAEKIRFEIKDDSGIVQTLYNIGMEYLKIKQVDKAINYFILSGYYAKINGLDTDLKQMETILNPLINRFGQSEFMKRGKKLYESWINQFN
jgi:tetratricopeptide (TPR) repeat protein